VGHIRTATHDYIRHGTVSLFAALNYLDGKIHACCHERPTHKEWLSFLKQIQAQTPKGVDVHLIADNYSTHKHAKVLQWLKAHPRFHMHFTPTSSSWLNLVERFFRDLTVDVVREGSFTCVREPTTTLMEYLANRNLSPQPYRWLASGESILRKIQTARQASISKVI
jgi:transposase